MKKLIIATRNKGKIIEIKEIFSDTNFEILSLNDFENVLSGFDVEENANSYEGNSIIKAMGFGSKLATVLSLKDSFILADDSGLEVDALGGRPGIKSARYIKGNDVDRNNRVLDELKEVADEDERKCRYKCVATVFNPQTLIINSFEGIWEGRIALSPRGEKSFGYAPIFLPVEFNYKKTNAECEPNELIKINHRGKAFGKMKEFLLLNDKI